MILCVLVYVVLSTIASLPFILCVLLYVVCFDDCCWACLIESGLGWMVNSLGGENPAKFWFYACMTGIGLAVLMCI